MLKNPRISRFLLQSPLPLLLLAVIPLSFIASTFLHFRLPFRLSTRMLLANSICLLAILAIRSLVRLYRLRRDIRYGSDGRPSGNGLVVARRPEQVRDDLGRAGFRFAEGGTYGEKPDRGYLGSALIYGGIFLLLGIGTWDNLRQFSGTLLHGVGIPADLSKRGSYFPLFKGPLATIGSLPKLEVTRQIFPSAEYPKGASEIALWSKEGQSLGKATLHAYGEPYRYGGFDIFMAKLLVDTDVSITEKGKTIFRDAIKVSPLATREGGFSLWGKFSDRSSFEGEAFFDPEKNIFRFVLVREGKPILDTQYHLYQYRQKTDGDFVTTVHALGKWSEIHVVRRRQMALLWIGGIMAAIGIVLRIAFRPQRVWLEDAGEGCRAWPVGGETKRLLKDER